MKSGTLTTWRLVIVGESRVGALYIATYMEVYTRWTIAIVRRLDPLVEMERLSVDKLE
jgi:hypothetical protein